MMSSSDDIMTGSDTRFAILARSSRSPRAPRAKNRRVLFKRALVAPLASQRDLRENYDTETEIEIYATASLTKRIFFFRAGVRDCTHAYRSETTLPLVSAYFRVRFSPRYNKSRARKREVPSHPPPPLMDASPKSLELARIPAKQRRETDRHLM